METGLTVTIDCITGVYKNMRRGIVALVFRCNISDGMPGPTEEARALAWLSADEVRDRMDEAYAVRMLDALSPSPPAIRAHDGTTLTQ